MRALIAILLATAPALGAAQSPIIAERPGFSTSPQALGRGFAQLETGVEWNLLADRGNAPQFLARYGLGGDTELQFGWSGFTSARARHRPAG
ncbi:hypothetical protein [Parvularcula lutaonensis]|uniref:Uncharacterized protein n=1 Tax=Parvularcula lutaonensis TaxID=491923 RepID=A0ABV7M9P5_9PROT|nr:hypothetical protein [Parvularcula lutaonensis]GGY45899.1 hypothetical protein GCM10007148_13690 [Parvularcula lutaonensis]